VPQPGCAGGSWLGSPFARLGGELVAVLAAELRRHGLLARQLRRHELADVACREHRRYRLRRLRSQSGRVLDRGRRRKILHGLVRDGELVRAMHRQQQAAASLSASPASTS
jgi:hypothetical protein